MKKSIGIDLGTSNSAAAIKDTSVKILRNKQGEELTRSCIGLKNGEFIVGRTAYQLLRINPVNTVLSVKRLMGGAITDPMVQEMKGNPNYKYEITSLKGGTEDAVAIILEGKQFTPEDLSSKILKKIKTDSEESLGDEITDAVITVPAYFTEKQKNATRIAALRAGLKVQKLLAEPTAAAIAYGVDNLKTGEARTVLIYDFGGGTFDLSILNIVDGQYMEAGTGGDRWLGGDDIDKVLQAHILNKVSQEYHIDNIETLIENLGQRKRFQFEAQFKENVENIKIELSSSSNAQLIMDGFEDENGEWVDFDLIITRDEFEEIAKPFIQRTIDYIETLFNEIGYDASMIDNILLVGGSSCIPLVKKMLSSQYGSDKIIISDKPMLTIAEGAAILSNRLGDEYEPGLEGENTVNDISYSTNHNYFMELEDGFDLIIEKQIPLPCNVLRNYKTTVSDQKVVKVGIFADVEGNKKELQTTGFFAIEEDLPKGTDIILDFTLGIDELFAVKAYPKRNKTKSKHVVLSRGGKDSKTFNFLESSIDKISNQSYNHAQKEFFFESIKDIIKQINSLNQEDHDSETWNEIGTKVFTSFEKAESITDSVDEEKMILIFANILINEYSDLIGAEETNRMKSLISKTNDEDPLSKIQANEQLKTITDKYSVLITLYTLKLASDQVAHDNPSDGLKLLQMHDQVVTYFKNRRRNEAFQLLDEALELKNSLRHNVNITKIHLGKSD